jgi:hypothetical protein
MKINHCKFALHVYLCLCHTTTYIFLLCKKLDILKILKAILNWIKTRIVVIIEAWTGWLGRRAAELSLLLPLFPSHRNPNKIDVHILQ